MEKTVKILKKPMAATLLAIFLAASGYHPFEAFGALLSGIFGRPKYISNVIIKSTPIILTGVSVAFAYKMGLFNIGAEGQFIVGAVAANIVGIVCDFPAIIEIPLVLLVGAAAGALYGGISGWLKAKYHINEVIIGIMLNWIALYLILIVFISRIRMGLMPFMNQGLSLSLPTGRRQKRRQILCGIIPL